MEERVKRRHSSVEQSKQIAFMFGDAKKAKFSKDYDFGYLPSFVLDFYDEELFDLVDIDAITKLTSSFQGVAIWMTDENRNQ